MIERRYADAPEGVPRPASRHLLLVAYYFPPMGGVPVRRVLRFLRELPRHGWRCSVLTADRPYDPFHPSDAGALDAIPPVERVVRAPARAGVERALVGAYRLLSRVPLPRRTPAEGDVAGGALRRRLNDGLFYPDAKRRWIPGAVAAGLRAAREDPVDAVLASGYPWSCFVAAHELGAALRRPVILDFRDAWSDNPRRLWASPRHSALEKRLAERSAALVAATDGIREDLARRYGEAVPLATVPNGYDPAERPEPDPDLVDPEHLVLTYTGTFNDALPPSRFDQSPYHLIDAIAALEPGLRRSLRVRLVGRVPEGYRRRIAELGLADCFEIPGAVSHRRSLQHQLAADVLLLVVGPAPNAAGIRTLKLAEYAGSGRPVLALAPEGEAARLVREHRLGWVEPPQEVEAIRDRLAKLLRAWRSNALPGPRPALPELAAGRGVATLAGVLDAALRSAHTPCLSLDERSG